MRSILALMLGVFIIAVAAYAGGQVVANALTIKSTKPAEKPQRIKLPRVKQPGEIWVMVIDTGISPHDKLKPYVQYDDSNEYKDSHGHGTHVAGIVAYGNRDLNDPLCSQVKIFSCKYWTSSNTQDDNMNGTARCLQKAIDMKMDYVNYSGGGETWNFKEYLLFKEFEKQGGISVVAAGNEHKPITDKTPYFPAMYRYGMKFLATDGKWKRAKGLKSIHVVEAVCGKDLCTYSNSHLLAFRENGGPIKSTYRDNSYAYMNGTSQATPAVLHTILKQRCDDAKVGVQQASN